MSPGPGDRPGEKVERGSESQAHDGRINRGLENPRSPTKPPFEAPNRLPTQAEIEDGRKTQAALDQLAKPLADAYGAKDSDALGKMRSAWYGHDTVKPIVEGLLSGEPVDIGVGIAKSAAHAFEKILDANAAASEGRRRAEYYRAVGDGAADALDPTSGDHRPSDPLKATGYDVAGDFVRSLPSNKARNYGAYVAARANNWDRNPDSRPVDVGGLRAQMQGDQYRIGEAKDFQDHAHLEH